MADNNSVNQVGSLALLRIKLERQQHEDAQKDRRRLLNRELAAKERQATFEYDAAIEGLKSSKAKAWVGIVGSVAGGFGSIATGIGSIVADNTYGLHQAKLARRAVQEEKRAAKLGHELATKENDASTARREALQIAEEQGRLEDKLSKASRLV